MQASLTLLLRAWMAVCRLATAACHDLLSLGAAAEAAAIVAFPARHDRIYGGVAELWSSLVRPIFCTSSPYIGKQASPIYFHPKIYPTPCARCGCWKAGGTEISFTMAIDYTASNGSPADPRSLHYVDPNGVVLNDYAKAMSGIGRVLEFYGENGGVALAAAAADCCFRSLGAR